MTIAKGLSSGYAPIAAAVVRDSVHEIFKEKTGAMGHLLTFGGHPVAAAAAIKNLEIFDEEKLVERGSKMGDYIPAAAEDTDQPPVGRRGARRRYGLGPRSGHQQGDPREVRQDSKFKKKLAQS